MGKYKSLDYKQTVVEYYHKTNSLQKACEPFGCNKMTLWRWIQRAKNGELENKPRVGAYKVTEDMVSSCIQRIKENPDTTLAQLQEMIQTEFGATLSQRHIARVVRDNNYTLKQKNKRHFPETYRNQPRNQKEEIATFLEKVRKHPIDKIISIDETSVVSGMSRNEGRQLIGKRLVEQTSHPDRFKKKTVVMAISSDGVEGWKIYDKGGMTSKRMVSFLEDVLKDKEGYMVVMDNAATHGTQEVEELKGAIQYSLDEIKKRGCCGNYFVHSYKEKSNLKRKPRLRPKKVYKPA